MSLNAGLLLLLLVAYKNVASGQHRDDETERNRDAEHVSRKPKNPNWQR